MSLVGSNVSSVIFSFLFTTERQHPKKITFGDIFKPGFSRKVRIQLFLNFLPQIENTHGVSRITGIRKNEFYFIQAVEKISVFFQSCHEKYSTGSWTVMVFGISVIKY